MLFCSTAMADCTGKLEGSFHVNPIVYDPFAPTDHIVRHVISIRNTSDTECKYLLAFTSASDPAKLDNTILYSIENDNGDDILMTEKQDIIGLRSANAPAGSSLSLSPIFVIPRGQLISPGLYTVDLSIQLFAISDDGTLQQAAVDTHSLTVDCEVQSILSVTLAGGGTATSVDFGEITSGEERTVLLKARANRDYRLELVSQNSGRLTLDPTIPGEEWGIDYSVLVDGTAQSLEQGVKIVEYNSPSQGETSHSLLFRLNDARMKRAGIYKDVVSIKIIPTH
jgi:hypothetical protein